MAGILPVLPVDPAAGAKVALNGDVPERSRVLLNGLHMGLADATAIITQKAVRMQ